MAIKVKKLHLLHPGEYEHPLDRQALNALEGTPGFEKLTRKILKHGLERLVRLQYTGSYIKVNEKSFPEVYNILLEVCDTLHLKKIPELYVQRGGHINAFAIGSENPIISVTTDAVDLLTDDELRYLIGHEIGHIKSGHMLYHTMAQIMPVIGKIIGSATLGIGGVVGVGIEYALLYWARMSELTADRAGLLACQNEDAMITALIKMAGAPKKFFDQIEKDIFIEQAREFKEYDRDTLDKIGKIVMIMGSTHPWTVMRASEILKWIDSGAYEDIIKRHAETSEVGFKCHKCGAILIGNENFCGMCGSKLWGR